MRKKCNQRTLVMSRENVNIRWLILGSRLEKARTSVGITVADMKEKVGVSDQSIYNYEKGKRAVPAWIVERYAQICHVTVETLYDRDEEAPLTTVAEVKTLKKEKAEIKIDLSELEKEDQEVVIGMVKRLKKA